MATPGPLERLNRVVLSGVTLPFGILRYAATEPVFTGSLLFALTRAPAQYRTRLLSFLRERGLSSDRIAILVKALKVLLIIGVIRRINRALTRLALNMWHFKKAGAPFRFGASGKPELVVVTGGCSGFGYEMTKEFSKIARVVVLDISPVPPELDTSMSAGALKRLS